MAKIYSIDENKLLSNKVYCTIDGVKTPVVYRFSENNYSSGEEYSYLNDLYVTSERRIASQIGSKQKLNLRKTFSESVTTTTTTAQGTTTTTATTNILPVCVFDFFAKVYDTSGGITQWKSSFGTPILSQTTSANRPSLGVETRGVNGFTPIYFNTYQSDFMSLDSAITVTGDFTMFFYIEPIGTPVNKYFRLLGKSDDNNMFLSIGERSEKSYVISFDGSTSSEINANGEYWSPSSKRLLITIQRSGTTLYVRENGTQITSGAVSANNFVFDQVGKLGNNTDFFFNGSIYHFSVFDGYLNTNLETIEKAIISSTDKAKGI
jgi:hypothetical protein